MLRSASRSIVFAVLAAALSACVTAGGAGQTYGAASCRASELGSCPQLSGKTLYARDNGEILYLAPNGTAYDLNGTKVRLARWAVSADGRRLLLPGSGGFGSLGLPIDAVLNVYETISGDPIGLASRNAVAEPLRPGDTRSFRRIARDLRG